MTTPSGDLPDWQTLVSPQVVPASVTSFAFGINATVFTSPNPFRIWGAYLSAIFAAQAAFAGGPSFVTYQLQDGAGNVLLSIQLGAAVANQVDSGAVAVQTPGLTPAIHLGAYSVILVVGGNPGNSSTGESGGIYYSQP